MSEFLKVTEHEIISETKLRPIVAPSYLNEDYVKNENEINSVETLSTDNEFKIVNVEIIPISFDELVKNIVLSQYYGPLPESNWVIKGKLIAGAYPGHIKDDINDANLINILNSNVTVFVNLQKEYKPIDPTWRFGFGIRPYLDDLNRIISNKDKYPLLTSTITKIKFIHKPIADLGIINDNETLKLAQDIFSLMQNGEVIYLHCWGGHGRTGVIVCLILHLMYGLNSNDAIRYCQLLHGMRELYVNVGSPQTKQQRDQVKRIIGKLI